MIKNTLLFFSCLASATYSYAHLGDIDPNSIQAVYADLPLLKKANIPVLYSDDNLQVGYAVISGQMQMRLSEMAHQYGRCGNYEVLESIPADLHTVRSSLEELQGIQSRDQQYLSLARNLSISARPEITDALQHLQSDNIRKTVEWLSNYPTRFNRGPDANKHVQDFYEKLQQMTSQAPFPVAVDLITHTNTPQKSIRVSIKGSERPDEHVILGGHLDSIVGWFGTGRAPGADDNASGSASLLEALRVLLSQKQPQRTVEFFWYAGEESGLLGSAQIAETYKNEKRNVIAVLQLDMTLFPGDGLYKIASMTDFTNPWLRDYLKAINTTYLNIEIQEDQCGYGCSDHASWHRRGFPAIFPTESKFKSSFQYIHTEKDVISPLLSFEHSLVFSKIALVMAMDLANSNEKMPSF
ncbi:M20/M25/M40 family metallo-hydrolase [Pseudobdellovibrio exovorus]|uniref:Peptidase M28 domain-containing protein n=1 Tax=Pseudobdellovibrio exovorus JSS TaxID=1184267 RepID=M4V7Y2_9BACT|nr:M20/M25/M40 family metallo-hydrolase [Pseudobdellovibrio exovorus]AGH95333.1 hypothetical protein A11Q_1117 [Pseudobdellovibrio exovorus JSS]